MFNKVNKYIGIIGVNKLGLELAIKYATHGYNIILYNDNTNINNVLEKIKTFNFSKINVTEKIDVTTNLNALINCNLIIESTDENLKKKQALFLALDKICTYKTIFVTTTFILNINEVSFLINRKDKFIGLNYFISPISNNLVEIIKCKETTNDVFEYVKNIQESLNKITIKSYCSPGFIVHRFFIPWLNESIKLIEEKITNIATIDFIIKKYLRIKEGPFELMNKLGIEIIYKHSLFLFNNLGTSYKPSFLLTKQITKDRLWILEGSINTSISLKNKIIKRLNFVISNILIDMISNEKICSAEDCDIGARVGLLWNKGPIELLNIQKSENINLLIEENKIKKINYNLFKINYVNSKIINNVGYVTFYNPDRLNTINEEIIDHFYNKYSKLVENKNIDSIVLEGSGKTFVSGVNIKFFTECIENNNINKIYDFTKKCHDIFNYVEQTNKLVICNLHGITLGAGLELALACNYLIASTETLLGFPETGMGIYPHLGGTQRTSSKIGVPLAKWMIFTGYLLNSKQAYDINLLDEIVSPSLIKSRIYNIASSSLIPKKKNKEISPLGKIINKIFSENKLEDILKLNISLNDTHIINSLKKIKKKSPIAISISNNLIELSSKVSIKTGLCSELDNIKPIFSTDDALEGLQSILEARKAVFKGH